jgi:hypothetical protein
VYKGEPMFGWGGASFYELQLPCLSVARGRVFIEVTNIIFREWFSERSTKEPSRNPQIPARAVFRAAYNSHDREARQKHTVQLYIYIQVKNSRTQLERKIYASI